MLVLHLVDSSAPLDASVQAACTICKVQPIQSNWANINSGTPALTGYH